MRPTLSPWCGRPGCARPHRTPPYACARAARAAPARTERRLTRVRGAPGLRPPAPNAALRVCAGPPGCARPHRTPPYACARAPGLRPPAPNAALRVCAGPRAAPARPCANSTSRCLRGAPAGARPHRTVASVAFFDRGTRAPRGAGAWGAAPPGGPLVAKRLAGRAGRAHRNGLTAHTQPPRGDGGRARPARRLSTLAAPRGPPGGAAPRAPASRAPRAPHDARRACQRQRRDFFALRRLRLASIPIEVRRPVIFRSRAALRPRILALSASARKRQPPTKPRGSYIPMSYG